MKKGDANDILRQQGPEGVARAFDVAEKIEFGARADRADEKPPERGAPPIGEAGDALVVLVNAADIEPEPVSWLWHNGLQLGVLNLFAGARQRQVHDRPLVVRHRHRRGKWPDGQVCSKPGRAVYWSGEDGIKDTLLPRFIAAGGDRDNMSFIEGVCAGERKRPFDPAADMPKLAQAVEKLGDVRMIVLDPIAVMLKGADSHKNVETRIGLQPFADLCASRGACGLGVHHFTKNTAGGDPLDRISGSLAFGALPRCGWVAAKDSTVSGNPRVLLRVKMSNGPDWGGFEYKLEQRPLDNWPDIEAQRVLWAAPIEGSAWEILAQFEDKPKHESPAVTFLVEALNDGPQLAAEVIANADSAGISERTLRRAFKDLGGVSERHGRGRGHFVIWELPRATQ